MFLWDALFPRRCLGCGGLGSYICLRCGSNLKPVITQTCLYCGRPSLWGLTHPTCRRREGVDGRLSLYYYNNTLKKILAAIKYSLVKEAFSDLSFMIGKQSLFLAGVVRGLGYPTLQPAPLSPLRSNERGFNQALIISRIFSSLLPLLTTDVLVKNKETSPQARLPDRRLRRGNIRGAFSVRRGKRPPEKIIIVDDVITTGETVKELARVLKRAGAKKVYALSVAKG
jgi:ComF family protein